MGKQNEKKVMSKIYILVKRNLKQESVLVLSYIHIFVTP